MMTGVWQAGGRMSRTLTLHLDTLMLICQRNLDTGYADTFFLQRQLDDWGTWILYRLILICQKHAAHFLYINFD